MRVLSMYRSRGDVEPMVFAAPFDTGAAAAEECDAPVATGLMSSGVWR
jgi:hypothetical protein